jgi:hypothetical protein
MKPFKITPSQKEIKESFTLPELLIKKIWQEGTYNKDGSKWESDWKEYLSNLKNNGINSNDFFKKSFKEIETGTFIFKPDTSIPRTLLWIDKNAQYPIIYTGEEDKYVIEYEGVDGFTNTYQMKWKKLIWINRYHSQDKKALFIDHVETENFLFEARKITKENSDRLYAYTWNIDTDELIPSDISNLISVGWYINISWSKFEKSLRFNSLEFIWEYFYYTDISGWEWNMKELDIILPRVSKEDKKEKCVPMNNIEYSFYEGAELMNDSLAVRVNNKWEPEVLWLFAPLFTNGLRKEMLWMQDLIQEVKKISPLYMVFPDKNNIPNNPKYIQERKHMVYMNRIEVVIKIPAWVLTGNKNENYILITKPQSKWGTAKDILFMDLTKKFQDAKKVSSVINTFLKGQLHNSDTYYNAISKNALIEPCLLEPSLYV